MMAMRNITRFDYCTTHGWRVAFYRRGTITQKLFSDAVHGGRRAALDAAVTWRDEIEAKLGPAKPRSAQVTGPGRVFRENRSCRYSDGVRHYWEAWTAWIRMPDGVKSTNYSIDKHGSKRAKDMAVAWLERKRAERDQIGRRAA